MDKKIYETLLAKYQYEISNAEFSLTAYFKRLSSVGEHTHNRVIEDVDSAISDLSNAQGKLHSLEDFYSRFKEEDNPGLLGS